VSKKPQALVQFQAPQQKLCTLIYFRTHGIPRKQFYKTILIKAKNKKIYKNFNIHYGTAMLGIRRPAEIYYKIMGLIDALSQAGE